MSGLVPFWLQEICMTGSLLSKGDWIPFSTPTHPEVVTKGLQCGAAHDEHTGATNKRLKKFGGALGWLVGHIHHTKQ